MTTHGFEQRAVGFAHNPTYSHETRLIKRLYNPIGSISRSIHPSRPHLSAMFAHGVTKYHPPHALSLFKFQQPICSPGRLSTPPNFSSRYCSHNAAHRHQVDPRCPTWHRRHRNQKPCPSISTRRKLLSRPGAYVPGHRIAIDHGLLIFATSRTKKRSQTFLSWRIVVHKAFLVVA